MKTKLTETIEIVDDDEVTIWRIDKGDGIVLINLNLLFDDCVSECEWLDDGHKLVQVMYSDWDSRELVAIVNTNGEILRKGINSIEVVLEKQKRLIVDMSGFGMGDDASDYFLEQDDTRMAVIDWHGDFVIDPLYYSIWFEETENMFYAEDTNGNELMFSIDGEPHKQENSN